MLTDVECKNAVCLPDKLRVRLACAGGLHLEVSPNGSTRWFWKYRKEGKEGRMAFGSYPDVSAKGARAQRDEAKKVKDYGIDPVRARKLEILRNGQAGGHV